MLVFQSIILGIVQGLAEFIPISSSAHLVIIPWLFGWNNPTLTSLTFDVALHLGTLLAVLVFFASDWARLIGAWFKSIFQFKIGDDPDRRMAWYLVLACIPGGISGVLLESKIGQAVSFRPDSEGLDALHGGSDRAAGAPFVARGQARDASARFWEDKGARCAVYRPCASFCRDSRRFEVRLYDHCRSRSGTRT